MNAGVFEKNEDLDILLPVFSSASIIKMDNSPYYFRVKTTAITLLSTKVEITSGLQ